MNLFWKQHHACCNGVSCPSLHHSSVSVVRRGRCHPRRTQRHHTSGTPVDMSLSLACVMSFCVRFAFGTGLSPCACWFSQTVTLSPGAFGFRPSQLAHIAMVLSVEWWLVPLFLFSIQLIGGWRPTNRSAHTSRMLHGYEDPDTRILADLQALVIGLLARIRKEPLSPER